VPRDELRRIRHAFEKKPHPPCQVPHETRPKQPRVASSYAYHLAYPLAPRSSTYSLFCDRSSRGYDGRPSRAAHLSVFLRRGAHHHERPDSGRSRTKVLPFRRSVVACACASLLDAFPLSLPIQVSLLSCLESLDHPGNPVRPTKVWVVRSIHQLCHNHSRLG
jgi:hypothetical protein